MARFIPLAKPLLGTQELEAIGRVLGSGWVTQGPEVAAFEREFAEFVGAPYACAVSSGTAALHLALLAAGVGPGDEVVTVSHSFIATANSIRYCGARPVFVDVEPGTFNMDPERLESAIGPRTRAVLVVHQLGMPADLDRILPVARRHDLRVVEDAACAVGSEIRSSRGWERIGRPHGDLACFSFHPRKLLTTGDGGIVSTADESSDRQLRLWRQHGMSVPDSVRHAARDVVFESYAQLGYNYRLTDIQAAVGRQQLERLPGLLEERRRGAARYRERLARVGGVRAPVEPEWARSNWQSYCVYLPEGVDQKIVMKRMLDRGVATRRGVMCAHREPAYPAGSWTCRPGQERCDCEGAACARLRNGERAQEGSILLPLFPGMTDAEQDAVVDALDESLRS